MNPELIIAQQKNEIAELKLELHKKMAEKSSRLEDSLYSKELFNHYHKVALFLSSSTLIPKIYQNKPDDIFIAMAMGYQLGFPVEQALLDIAVINGRPCLWGDGLLSLTLSHPQCEYINEEKIFDGNDVVGFRCCIKRKGHEEHQQTFTLTDAHKAGLLSKGAVWSTYPTRMLQMRARSLAIRDKFADALRGIRLVEIEEEDKKIIDAQVEQEGEIINELKISQSNSGTDRLKSILRIKKQGVKNEGTNSKENFDPINGDTVPCNFSNNESLSFSEDAEHNNRDENNSQYDNGDAGQGPRMARDNDVRGDGIAKCGRASPEQIEKINRFLKEKEISQERIAKYLWNYKITILEDLTNDQAIKLINKLEEM